MTSKAISQHSPEKFAKKLLGESEIEAVLQRLDRLTQEEGRMTVAQTLEVVYGLMNTMKVVMNGTPKSSQLLTAVQLRSCLGRWYNIDDWYMEGSRYVFAEFGLGIGAAHEGARCYASNGERYEQDEAFVISSVTLCWWL